jgi:hypothetical protein
VSAQKYEQVTQSSEQQQQPMSSSSPLIQVPIRICDVGRHNSNTLASYNVIVKCLDEDYTIAPIGVCFTCFHAKGFIKKLILKNGWSGKTVEIKIVSALI